MREVDFSWRRVALATVLVIYTAWFAFTAVRVMLGINGPGGSGGLGFLAPLMVAAIAAVALWRLFSGRRPAVSIPPALAALIFVVETTILLSQYAAPTASDILIGSLGMFATWLIGAGAVVAELLILWAAGRLLELRPGTPASHPAGVH